MNFDDLLIDPLTAKAISNFVKSPSHAVLLFGPQGSGKGTVAQNVMAALLQTTPAKLVTHAYFTHVEPKEGKEIGIEDVRQLQRAVQLKTIGNVDNVLRRGLIIEQAQLMTREAQNALLKTLEEPPADTLIILTATSLNGLLPTIVSRLQQLPIRSISLLLAKDAFASTYSAAAIERAHRLSKGAPALLAALLQEDTNHPLVQALVTVKEWLQQSTFERLAQIDGLIKNKADLNMLLTALVRTAEAALAQAASRGQKQLLTRWTRILAVASNAQQALAANAQPKLLLTQLMLEL